MKKFFKKVFATALGLFLGTLLSLLILPFLIVLLVRVTQGGAEPIDAHSVLHLKMRGEVVDHVRPLDFDFFSPRAFAREDRPVGLYELSEALTIAKGDPRIDGVFLDFKHLEIGWANAVSLHAAIRDFAQSGKFVYAYADDYSEKTYFLATAADRIFLQPSGDLEFNGIAINSAFLKGLLAKLELEPRIFRVGKFKAAVEPFLLEQMSEESREQEKTLVTDIWTSILPEWTRISGKKPEELEKLASTLSVTSPQSALDSGFVHQLAFRDEVEDLIKKKTAGEDQELSSVSASRLLKEKRSGLGSKRKVAVLFAQGEIVSGHGGFDRIGSDSILADIKEIKEEEDVRAIVVRIDSPGGDALASDVIWRELSVADEEIPVVASMGDVAASGGYYMAAGARYIFAEPTTITGSIGVFGLMFGSEKFFRSKLGVKFDRVVTHPHADIGNPNRAMAELEKQKIQGSVERVYSRFLEVVEISRPFKERAEVEKVAEGRVWSGVRAKEIGLVDELGGLNKAVAKAAEFAHLGDDYEVEVFPRYGDPLSEFLETMYGDAVEAWFRSLAPLVRSFVKAEEVLAKIPEPGVYTRLPFDLELN